MRSLIYKILFLFNQPYLRFNSEKLRVLAYHGVVDAHAFESHLKYVKRHFSVIDVHYLWEHLFNGKKLPEKPLLVTFDDGEISVLEKGLPLLKKYAIPSICFVITDLINTQKPFWWEEIRYYLGQEKGNKKSWEVKSWKNEQREIFLQDLRKESSKPMITRNQLTDNQLWQMKEAGIAIANHSHTHPMLNMCSKERVNREIAKSSSILKSKGFSDNVFAYPNGNFDQKVENVLEESGIKLAFLFDHKLNQKNINPLRISRIRVDSDTQLTEFKVKVSGLHSFIYNRFSKRRS